MPATPLESVHRVLIQVPPARVLDAFFDGRDLGHWWQVVRSVTIPRPLGTYAVEWETTQFRDEVLGLLGGAFHGTVMEYRAGAELFVAEAFWQPPEGRPIGPMALEVKCRPQGGGRQTELTVRQSGENDGPRWERYFQIVSAGWDRALGELKDHLEREAMRLKRWAETGHG
ncbi:MAG: SRPBCC domain-containing protein [Vicinamibacterales bacterium]